LDILRGLSPIFGDNRILPKRMIYFPKARFWVHTRELGPYLLWTGNILGQCGLGTWLRHIWNPKMRNANDIQELKWFICNAQKLGTHVSWVRYPTDSTRVQVFDRCNTIVTKITKPGFNCIINEIMVRKNYNALPAPKLVAVDKEGRMFAEEWINGGPARSDNEILKRVVSSLEKSLYRIEYLSADKYFRVIRQHGHLSPEVSAILKDVLYSIGGGRVPVSQVHGDLAPSNIIVSPGHGIKLIDWEYTRLCLLSYDAWLYFYSQRSLKIPDDRMTEWKQTFYSQFRNIIQNVPILSVLSKRNLRTLHLLHLIERLSFLEKMDQESTLVLRKCIKDEINYEYRYSERILTSNCIG